jgi:hypothetical protein
VVYLGESYDVSEMAVDEGEHRQPGDTDGDVPTPAIDELRSHNSWVCWTYVDRPGSIKPTKPPVNPHNGRGASHSNPSHWGSHKQAKAATRRYKLVGEGFVLSDKDDFTGIDLDNCRDPETGEFAPWVEAVIALGETYTEISPSGRGVRLFARGKVASTTKCDPAGVEIYGKERYLTVTEDHVEGTPIDIRPAPGTLEMLLSRVEAMRPAREEAPRPAPHINTTPRSNAGQGGGGNDFFKNVNDRALQLLGMWVPVLHPGAKYQQSTGAYRVSSRALGRSLQEDLSYHPEGIKDHGVADMGDANQGRRTPIDSVIEHGGAPDAIAAAKWLCERIGKTPESLGWRDVAQADEEISRIGDKIAEGLMKRAGIAPEPPPQPEPESTAQGGGRQTDPLDGFIFDGDAPLEPPPMLVKKLLPLDGICFVGGQSGAGKTFVVVDLAVSLASGEPFFGHTVTERVGVAIFAAEGASTIASRVMVARDQKAGGEIQPIAWLGAVPDLLRAADARAMIARLRAVDARFRETHGVRLGAIVLDTLAATFALDDENDNSKAAAVIRAMKVMGDALGVVMVPVHHFGKDTQTGLRGASAWRAGCDTVLSVLAERDQTTGQCSDRRLALTKSRVGEEGWTAPFELRFVNLGEDCDGDEYGACYVEAGRPEDIITTVKEKGPPRYAKVYLDALSVVVGDRGRKVRPFGSEGSEVTAVDREDIRGEFYRLWPADGEDEQARTAAKCKSFNRGERWATDHRLIASYEVGARHMVWLLLKGAGQ